MGTGFRIEVLNLRYNSLRFRIWVYFLGEFRLWALGLDCKLGLGGGGGG